MYVSRVFFTSVKNVFSCHSLWRYIYIKFLTNSHFTQEEKKSVRKHTHTHTFFSHTLSSYLGSHKVWRKKIHSSGRF